MDKKPSLFQRLVGNPPEESEEEDTVKRVDFKALGEEADEETADVETSAPPADPAAAEDTAQRPQDEPAEEPQEAGQLTVDVYETDNDIVIVSPVAGVDPQDVEIDITEDVITIKGTRSRDQSIADDNYLYQECYWGAFTRTIILPADVDKDNADAVIRNGILTIRIPKLEREQMKKVAVRAA